jgi:hypothetical protein
LVQHPEEELVVSWLKQEVEFEGDSKEMVPLEIHQDQVGFRKADLLEVLCTKPQEEDLVGDRAMHQSAEVEHLGRVGDPLATSPPGAEAYRLPHVEDHLSSKYLQSHWHSWNYHQLKKLHSSLFHRLL